MEMHECPKYDRCSAPACPLWDINTTHLKGERVCFYLREYVKQGGRAKLLGVLPREMVNQIAEVLPVIISRHSDIKKQLNRSALTGSKIDALCRTRRAVA